MRNGKLPRAAWKVFIRSTKSLDFPTLNKAKWGVSAALKILFSTRSIQDTRHFYSISVEWIVPNDGSLIKKIARFARRSCSRIFVSQEIVSDITIWKFFWSGSREVNPFPISAITRVQTLQLKNFPIFSISIENVCLVSRQGIDKSVLHWFYNNINVCNMCNMGFLCNLSTQQKNI